MSVIHFAGCLILALYLLYFSLSFFQINSIPIREGDFSTGEIIFEYAVMFALFLPSSSSIYLLAIRWMYPENYKMAHIKLINKIIYYLNFAIWTGWLIFGIWGITALESLETDDNRLFEVSVYLSLFLGGIYTIPLSVSGILLFLFSTEFWRQDLIKLFKSKSEQQIKESA